MRSQNRPARPPTVIPLIAVAVFFGALVVFRVALEVAYSDRIYPGVHAAGLDLGGLTVGAATNELQTQFTTYANQSITVQAGDQTAALTPAALGYKPNAQALAEASYTVGRQGDLVSRLVGPLGARELAIPLSPGVIVDEPTLDRAVRAVAAHSDRPVVNADLQLAPITKLTPSREGQALDQVRARAMVEDYLLNSRSGPLVLPETSTSPKVTTAELAPLQAQAQQILAQSVQLTDGQQTWTIPSDLVRSALTVQSDPPALAIKADLLLTPIQAAAQTINRPAHDASLAIASGKISVQPDATGQAVDVDATVAALHDKLLGGDPTIPLVVRSVDPLLKASDLEPMANDAQSAIDQGLVLTVENQDFPITPAQVAELVVVKQDGSGHWNVTLDSTKVAPIVHDLNQRFEHPAVDARFGWNNGTVTMVQPQVPGVGIDEAGAVAAILDKWRTGKVGLPVAQTTLTVDDRMLARVNQDLTGKIQERQTSFAGSIPERAHNVALAMSRLNGDYIPPGATFSFNRAVGPTTLAAGFQWGFGYSTQPGGSSQVVPSVAGGICQVATTLFQPVFWSGYQIEERHWHMFAMHNYADNGYIGLDATVAPEDGVDFQFTNDSDHGLLILAWTQDSTAHVALVGTKPDWTVKVDPEQVTNVTPAPTGVDRSESPMFARGRQIILEEAEQGLTSHVTRHVVYPDGHDRTLKLVSTYQSVQTSILVGTGDPAKTS